MLGFKVDSDDTSTKAPGELVTDGSAPGSKETEDPTAKPVAAQGSTETVTSTVLRKRRAGEPESPDYIDWRNTTWLPFTRQVSYQVFLCLLDRRCHSIGSLFRSLCLRLSLAALCIVPNCAR